MRNTTMTKWQSFNGKVRNVADLDHQHLSNIFWYGKIILNNDKEFMNLAEKEITDRFNGQLLPYKPHVNFKHEIDFLKMNGHLEVVSKTITNIIFDGEKIGEINYFLSVN